MGGEGRPAGEVTLSRYGSLEEEPLGLEADTASGEAAGTWGKGGFGLAEKH